MRKSQRTKHIFILKYSFSPPVLHYITYFVIQDNGINNEEFESHILIPKEPKFQHTYLPMLKELEEDVRSTA